MNRKNKTLIAVTGIVLLVVFTAAIRLRLGSRSGSDDSGASQTPLGGLFSRAAAVSDLKQRMSDLRAFHPALMEFAKTHDGDLLKMMAELKPFLPPKLTYLEDEHWEMPSAGKLTTLMHASEANSTILLQQKDVLSGQAKIIVYADGHIEYRK